MSDGISEILGGPLQSLSCGSDVDRESAQLREACQQFEGFLLGILLKESMRETLSEGVGDQATGFDQFRDFCLEQVADSMAESSSLGIADQLYEQFTQTGVRS